MGPETALRCVGNRTYAIEWLEMDETKSVQRKTGYQSSKKEACKAIGHRQSAIGWRQLFSRKCTSGCRIFGEMQPEIEIGSQVGSTNRNLPTAIPQLQCPMSNVPQCDTPLNWFRRTLARQVHY